MMLYKIYLLKLKS